MDQGRGITYIWDMRMATSSIPRDTLAQDPLQADQSARTSSSERRIARFYLQCERYEEARAELAGHRGGDFPDHADVKEQLAPIAARSLQQLGAERFSAS